MWTSVEPKDGDMQRARDRDTHTERERATDTPEGEVKKGCRALRHDSCHYADQSCNF